jgi:ABC-type transporter Mla MlaB component
MGRKPLNYAGAPGDPTASMKAAKRKRAATASARASTVAVPDVAAPADPLVAECLAAEAVQVSAEVPPAAVAPIETTSDKVAVTLAAPSTPVVTLSSNCTVKDAAALKESLCAVVHSEEPVTIDVGGVERIDTAAVQVLCSFVRERAADARGVVWLGVTDALNEAANLLGVREMLKLPVEGGAA